MSGPLNQEWGPFIPAPGSMLSGLWMARVGLLARYFTALPPGLDGDDLGLYFLGDDVGLILVWSRSRRAWGTVGSTEGEEVGEWHPTLPSCYRGRAPGAVVRAVAAGLGDDPSAWLAMAQVMEG